MDKNWKITYLVLLIIIIINLIIINIYIINTNNIRSVNIFKPSNELVKKLKDNNL